MNTPATGSSSSLTRTANQLRAADPSASAWVSANAGTGKTHVLIDRISRLLLSGVRPERILCLTFTKAAAAEMSNRLNHKLAQWARADDATLRDDLRALTGAAKAPDDLAPARRLFAQVLEAPGGLNIRTIHSFCESLLGRFPLEANVSPHFSVLDERTTAELLEEARDRLLVSTLRPGGEAIADALKLLAGLIGEGAFADLNKELSFRRGRFAELIAAAGGIDALVDTAWRTLGLEPGETAETVLAAAVNNSAFEGKTLRQAADILSGGKKTDAQRSQRLAEWLAMEPAERAQTFTSLYAGCFLTNEGNPRASLITKGLASANPEIADALIEEQARVLAIATHLSAIHDAEATAALLRFGHGLLDEFSTLKESRALLDYDDLILKTLDLLNTDGGVSWVHYKLDGGIDHVLVDEAQDTSPEQWEVIRRLADDFYSGFGAREPGERTVFAVGDEKQSIYSFQGADPEGFNHMRTHFHARVEKSGSEWRTVDLTTSYRSVSDVLKVVDKVFSTPAAADGLASSGTEIRHQPERMGHAGRVEIWPTVRPPEKPDEMAWDEPVDRIGMDAPPIVLAEHIADTIAEWLESGEILASANRPIREDDIMILVRRRGVFAEAMIRALKTRNVAVAGSDRMVLIDQMAVMDLVALGRFALLPDDDLTLAEVLKGPFIGFDDEVLFDVAHGREGSLWNALRTRAADDLACRKAADYLSHILAHADYAPPFEFYAHVLAARGGRHAILSRLGVEAADPLDEFLNLALDFERIHTPSLQGFLHWVADGETQIKRDLEINRREVRVLTIHGSKGLQSNIIFLPDTCSVPSKGKEAKILWGDDVPLWQPKKDDASEVCKSLRDAARHISEQEYRRLLYVAMTRARDRLYICGFEGKNARSDESWYDLALQSMTAEIGAVEISIPGFDDPGLMLTSDQVADPESDTQGHQQTIRAERPPEWANDRAPEEDSPPTPLAPSRPEEDEPATRSPFDGDDSSRFQRGVLIHRLLQSLPDVNEADRPAAARDFLARPVHDLSGERQHAILDETLAVLSLPDTAPLFGPESLAEVPLTGTIGNHVLSAQVDRLLIEDDTVTIIDYKTNRPPPKKVEDVTPLYLRQMAAYREALKRIYPDRAIRCLLLWTDGPRVMALPDAMLDAHAPE